MEEDRSRNEDDRSNEEEPPPITGLELLHDAITKKAPRELIGKQADAWFQDRKERRALAKRHMYLAYGLAAAVLVCLTCLVASDSIPKDAALPLFGTIVGAVFIGRRGNE